MRRRSVRTSPNMAFSAPVTLGSAHPVLRATTEGRAGGARLAAVKQLLAPPRLRLAEAEAVTTEPLACASIARRCDAHSAG